MRLFFEVTGLEQALVQKIVGLFEEAYLADIRNSTKNSINNTVVGVLTHLQDNYIQLMPNDLLKRDDIVKKTIYNPHNLIAIVFFAVEELLKFSDITRTSYMQIQAFSITNVILQRTGKFRVAIRKWNRMPEI